MTKFNLDPIPYSFIKFSFGLISLIQMVMPASAQLTIQSSPVFSSPTPSKQLEAKEEMPFKGEVIEFQREPLEKTALQQYTLESIDIPTAHYYRPWVIRRALTPVLKDKDHPLSEEELKKRLNRINQFSPFKLQAKLVPDLEVGKTRLKMDLYEKQPWQLTGTFDNQGRPGLGYYRGGIQVTNRSLLGMGDEFTLQYVSSSHSHRLFSSYSLPLNSKGGELELGYSFQRDPYDPAFYPPEYHYMKGTDNAATILFSQPLDPNWVWTPYASFIFRKVTVLKDNSRVTGSPRPLTLGRVEFCIF